MRAQLLPFVASSLLLAACSGKVDLGTMDLDAGFDRKSR